jgi:conjugal transfer pilus assembly protein TraF
MKILLLAAVCAALASPVFAQSTADTSTQPVDGMQQKADKGWFFYEDPPKVVETPASAPEAPAPPQQAQETKPKEKTDKCSVASTWTPDCGFVNPGRDFDFQSKERDALMQNMVMSNNDPKAVEQFQYYMKWMMSRAVEVTNLWQYNMTQNPDLDPSVRAPVSTFGLRLMTEVQANHQQDIFRAIKEEDGMLVYFSRSDCDFCHSMSHIVQDIANKTGLQIWNASLDNTCLPEFAANCRTAADTLQPAQLLQVTTVPTLFLYIGPNTWIRLSTGVVDEASITSRLVDFFSAYRNAMLKGVKNSEDGRPSVDFSDISATGAASGVQGTKDGKVKAPTDDDVARLLGKAR